MNFNPGRIDVAIINEALCKVLLFRAFAIFGFKNCNKRTIFGFEIGDLDIHMPIRPAIDRAPPHVPVPATITVAAPAGWTWDPCH
ncbi:hypothetical protein AVEN_105449-1 [Araneus ventricosus]|uniref:Uncharacterized protein n=1 Tax=Araneus ventricosus TaxID=182803 RepID=A0A4Y2IK25_ARAVE|nr:hypothetical protein AVEN_105449-1 [Araneus ventricosus]